MGTSVVRMQPIKKGKFVLLVTSKHSSFLDQE